MTLEYKEISVQKKDATSLINDCAAFGWQYVESVEDPAYAPNVTVRFSRSASLVNRAELLRLESQFESCRKELAQYENSIARSGMILPLATGLVGAVLIICAVFVHWAFALAAVPFIAAPIFLSRHLVQKRRAALEPFAAQKRSELETTKKKAASLLGE